MNPELEINNELKRTRTNSYCMSSFQFVPVRCLNYQWNSYTDNTYQTVSTYPCTSEKSMFSHNQNLS